MAGLVQLHRLARRVKVRRLTDRVAPGRSWARGDVDEVSVDEARLLIARGHAELAPGESLPQHAPEQASFPDTGETAAAWNGRGRDSS